MQMPTDPRAGTSGVRVQGRVVPSGYNRGFPSHRCRAMNAAAFLSVGLGAACGAWLRWWLGTCFNPVFAHLPLGTLIANLTGGYLIGVVFIGVDEGAFWSQMQASVDFRYDVWSGIVKSFVFGVAVSLIAVFEGYDAVPTAEGVSSSIKSTVVQSALAILALDFVLTSFMFREA